jgi:small subunit ribosomal protein S2
MTSITMRQMLEAGVHFGHQKRFWNPKMAPYIFGIRHQIHIINLEHTLPLYKDALNFLGDITAKKGKVLFVGTKRGAQDIIREEATRCGMPYVDKRWLGGMLTNYKTIRQSIRRLKELETMTADGSFMRLTKKEALMQTRELAKLQSGLNGIKDMGGLPDALFIIDIGHEKTALTEAKKLGIPVVGVVDTNYNPQVVDYVVPGNDDSQRAIRLYCQGLADAILDARQHIVEQAMVQTAKGSEPLDRAKTSAKKMSRDKASPAAEATAPAVEKAVVQKEPAVSHEKKVETASTDTAPAAQKTTAPKKKETATAGVHKKEKTDKDEA